MFYKPPTLTAHSFIHPFDLQRPKVPLWKELNQGCLLGLILSNVDIKKVKTWTWVMSAESKNFKSFPSSVASCLKFVWLTNFCEQFLPHDNKMEVTINGESISFALKLFQEFGHWIWIDAPFQVSFQLSHDIFFLSCLVCFVLFSNFKIKNNLCSTHRNVLHTDRKNLFTYIP